MNQDKIMLKARANQYMQEHKYLAVIQCIEQLLIVDPSDAEAIYMIAAAYLQIEDYENAIKYANIKLSINEVYQMETYLILAYAYNGRFDYTAAIDSLNDLLMIAENDRENEIGTQYHNFIGTAYKMLASNYIMIGNVSEGKSAYLKASIFKDNITEKVGCFSSYLFSLNFELLPDEFVFSEHKNFQQLFKQIIPYKHSQRKKSGKIKIGYISPDFRQHVMLFFYYQLLACYDKNKFQVTCYSLGKEDIYTEQLKALVDCWRNLDDHKYDQIAKIIYEDQIDILVDLAGHCENSGLPVLAYKPAPIQVSGLGYFNTTGLEQVDYFFTDQYVDPVGKNDEFFTEKLVRLSHSHFCYTGRTGIADCKESPCIDNGFITFCSFNRIAKLTDQMLCAWREILIKVPGSRLIFKNKIFSNESTSNLFKERLKRLGFDMQQVEFRIASLDYMDEYLNMDIALDTFPYQGGGTTCDALYMGVPVITLVGERHGARFGYSILKNIGLDECIATTIEEYIEKAVTLAQNKERLNSLHQTLRARMIQSPLMDGKQYILDIESAYQQMWLEFINHKQGQNMNILDDETAKEIKVLKQYIKLKPKDTQALKNLANLHMIRKEYEKVLELTDKLLALDQLDYEAMYIAAAAYLYLDNDEQGFALAKRVLEIKPDFIGAYMAMVLYYDKKMLLKENIDTLHKVVSLVEQKDKNSLSSTEYELFSQAWQQLGASNLLLGNISKAKDAYLKASEIKKDLVAKSEQYSGYLMCTNYDLSLSNKSMLVEHKKFNKFFSEISQYQHTASQQKAKLRIGYISPDFCSHAVAFYCYPLLVHYNKEKFEVVCYHKGKVDITTERLKSFGTVWRDISELSEAEAAKLIYEDKIDILVELAGHTAHNCLPILAYKPAPIQLCGIGYFNTTGLDAVDYFLTDYYVDPIGENDTYFTEKLLRLSKTHWCYTNHPGEPDCQETAYMKNKYITFCSFNNFAKMTEQMLLVWKAILARVPNSKLVLKNKVFGSKYGCSQISQWFLSLGISLSQIEFRPFTSNHMQEYLEMDIALDTYPYVGGATTCEALYMGVPVITLVGNRHGSRFGYSMLKNIGLEECIAYSEAEYIEKAVALASDIERLNELHKGGLRKKMLASPLMDGKGYMRELEKGYQTIWNDLVREKNAERNKNMNKNMNMKIAFILPLCFDKPSGGFRIVYEYADRLAARGHEVSIYYGCVNEKLDRIYSEVLIDNLFFCIRNKFPITIEPSWFKFSSEVKNYIVPEISDMYVCEHDVIIATAWGTTYDLKRLSDTRGEKYYLIQHYETLMKEMYPEELVNETYHLGFHNIVISKWLKEVMYEIDASVYAYIPNGVDLHYFKVTRPIETRNPLSIFMMWYNAEWKGINEGLHAIKLVKQKYPEVVACLFGTDERPSNLPEWIRYVCSPSREQLCELYNEHAIFVSPSWLEGFGLPGAEAMGCGCALVTTDSKGVRDYAIDGETALMSEPKDARQLAENIACLIEDNQYRIALAQRGNQYVQRFNWDAAVNKMEALFKGEPLLETEENELKDILNEICTNGIAESTGKALLEHEASFVIQEVKALPIAQDIKIDLLNAIAVNFYEQQYFEHIIPFLSAALEMDEDNDITLGNLGFALYNFGEKELARQYLSKVKNKDENMLAMLEE